MKIIKIVNSLLIIGIVYLTSAQASISFKDGSGVKIPGLGKILDIDTSNMIDKVGKWFEDKCDKNGAGSAKKIAKYFADCVRSLKTDEKTLSQDINVNENVTKKYCNVVPGLQRCIKNITVAVAPCLEQEEKETIDILLNVTSLLPEFICMNEGEDIAKFIAADGVDCVSSKKPEIEACANETFGEYIMAAQSASSDISLLSLLVVDLDKCMGMEKFRNCIFPVLKTCADPIPSFSVDSFFNYVRRITPCEKLLSEQVAPIRLTASPESIFGIEIPRIPYLEESKAAVCLVREFKDLKRCVDEIHHDLGGCRNVEMIQDCAVNLVNECKATFISNIVDSMFGIINHALRCDVPGAKEMLRCDALSHASSAGVVSTIALLIIAVAISL